MLAVLVVAGCGAEQADIVTGAEGEPTAVGGDVVEARLRWAEVGPETYHYEVMWSIEAAEIDRESCIGQSRVTVEVVDGAAQSAIGAAGCVVDASDPRREPLTAAEWFDYLAAVDPDTDLQVEFSELGFPTYVLLQSADSFIEASVSAFTVGPADRSEADRRQGELAEARGRWEQAGITSYDLDLSFDCFCDTDSLGPFVVEVRDGVPVEIRREGESVLDEGPAESWSGFLTVDELFDRIEGWLLADGLTVTYDPDRGHPVSIRSDPDLGTSDDELGITIRDLTPVAGK